MNKKTMLFIDYYKSWIELYKHGSVREVTMKKYWLTLSWLEKLIPNLMLWQMDRSNYQSLLNEYAMTHERQTTMDFHHQLKGAILDAVDERLINKDPTRKVVIKGKKPREKKIKYLNQFQLQLLLSNLDLNSGLNNDWMIMVIAKTGIRFSEALGITREDFNYEDQSLTINKTWNYKGEGGFQDTKNKSSNRKIKLDWKTMSMFNYLLKDVKNNKPIFVIENKIYNSTVNYRLKILCEKCNIPIITIHSLRHTHASLLLYSGVSIASVSMRLGHSDMTTTQKTYLHVVQELENKDTEQVMRLLTTLN